jgi:sugar/nucleoside kinase (ribokinase family)
MNSATSKSYDVVVVGELNPDLILSGDVTPAFGQVEKLVRGAELTIGSSAGIFACGAARLGLRVALIGKVGADAFGDFMRREVAARGVDLSGVRVDPAVHTGLTLILNRGADRAILTYPGAIPLLAFDEIDLEIVARARHLHLASYYLLDRLRPDVPRLFQEARRLGLSISLDPNYDPSGEWDGGLRQALALSDVFLPNQTELLAISGAADLRAGMDSLAAPGPLLAVKQGSQGACGLWQGQFNQMPSLPVQAVDTVGAGDSFDAGFLYGYLQANPRWSLEQMLRLGCVCGALSTRAAGGTSAQPTLEEAAGYLDEYAI